MNAWIKTDPLFSISYLHDDYNSPANSFMFDIVESPSPSDLPRANNTSLLRG